MTRTPAARRAYCLALLERLSEYVDDELSPAQRRGFERHLAGCACCGRLARRMRTLVALCREATGPRLRGAARRDARARIAALLASKAGRR